MASHSDDKIESILFINSPVYIYGIPPLKSISRGYRANEWDVSNPLWEGRLKVVEISDLNSDSSDVKCELRLEDETTGELFASAPYSKEGKGVDAVSAQQKSSIHNMKCPVLIGIDLGCRLGALFCD